MKKCLAVCSSLLWMLILVSPAAAQMSVETNGFVVGDFQAAQGPDLSTADLDDTTWNTSFGNGSQAVFWVSTEPSEAVSVGAEVQYQQASNTLSLATAMIDWSIKEGQAVLRFGKFFFPFGIEDRSRTALSNRLVTRPYFTGWTDNGAGLHGDVDVGENMQMAYALAVGNGLAGTGLGSRTTDTGYNNNKSIGGRVEFMPIEAFNVGGSAAWGKYDTAGENNYILAGGHAIYQWEEYLDARGEFIYRTLAEAGTGGADVNSMIAYGQAAYRVMPEAVEYVEGVVRFSWMDPNTDTDDDAYNQIAFGGSVSPVENLIFKAEFQINNEPEALKSDNNMLLIQAVYGWK